MVCDFVSNTKQYYKKEKEKIEGVTERRIYSLSQRLLVAAVVVTLCVPKTFAAKLYTYKYYYTYGTQRRASHNIYRLSVFVRL